MKVTDYYRFTLSRPDRSAIKVQWLQQAINDRTWESIQSDGRIRRWTWIPEEKKFLRVILLEDGETLHNAFFDRRFNPGGPE